MTTGNSIRHHVYYIGIASIALMSLCVATNASFAESPNDASIMSKNNEGKWVTRYELKAHSNAVSDVAYSADGSTLVSCGWDKKIFMYEMSSGKPTYLPSITADDRVTDVIVSPAARTLAFRKSNRNVEVWDAKSNRLKYKSDNHGVESIAFTSKGESIVTGSDRQVAVLEASTGNVTGLINGSYTDLVELVVSKDDTRVAGGSGNLFSSSTSFVRIWDLKAEKLLHTLKGHEAMVWSVSFSDDGELLASGSRDGTIRIWDARSGKEKHVLEGHDEDVRCVVFMPNSSRLASGGDDGTIKIWDAKSGKCLETLEGHTMTVTSLSFSPNGKYLASGSEDTTVRIWKQQD
jgi:WD40 repeat protein